MPRQPSEQDYLGTHYTVVLRQLRRLVRSEWFNRQKLVRRSLPHRLTHLIGDPETGMVRGRLRVVVTRCALQPTTRSAVPPCLASIQPHKFRLSQDVTLHLRE